MKKTGLLIFILLIFTAGAETVKYDSFESGVPAYWRLTGRGRLTTNPWHYKHGKKSLQWDFANGDTIRINNMLGDLERRGGWGNVGAAAFGMSIYLEQPLKDKVLQIQFRTDEKVDATLNIPLGFSCWQSVFVQYTDRIMNGRVTEKTNNILIKAPNVTRGKIYIDLVVYNGLLLPPRSMPRKTPWVPPAIDAEKFPLPDRVSEVDLRAMSRIKDCLPRVNFTNNPPDYKLFDSFKKLKIVEDSHGIRGTGLTYMGHMCNIKVFCEGLGIDGLKTFHKDVYRACMACTRWYHGRFSKKQFRKLEKNGVTLMKHLLDQGFNTSGHSMYYVSHKSDYFYFVYFLRDAMAKAGILKQLTDYLQYERFALFAPPRVKRGVDMDYFFVSKCYFMLALMQDNDKKRIQALRYVAYKLSKEILISDCGGGFKVDGSAYHHSQNYYSYAQGAMEVLCTFADACKNSSFAFSDNALRRLKKVLLNMYFYTDNLHMPLALRGRHPFSEHRWFNTSIAVSLPENLKKLASSMNDRQLAQAYINLKPEDKKFAEMFSMKPGAWPQGNLAMPYGGIVVQRRDDWLAIAYGYGKYYYGSEVSVVNNRFGMYTPNGSLEVLGPNGGLPKNLGGWDWNRIEGATVIYYPVEKMRPSKRGRVNLTTPYGFYGGISWRKRNGCFAMKIYGRSYDESFKGYKTYFMIDDRIYALGSNITCRDKKYPVQTNIYQKHLKSKDDSVFVDGKQIKAFPVLDKSLSTRKEHYLLDPAGNGYYLSKGQNVYYARKRQSHRNHRDKKDTAGDFATAWIDHGRSPDNAEYEYVILPFCGEKKLLNFSSANYNILQKDKNAHIIHDKITDIYGAIFFKESNKIKLPYVSAVDRNCMIMYKRTKNALELAIGDPDPHRQNLKNNDPEKIKGNDKAKIIYWRKSRLTPLKVSFTGKWKLKTPVDGIKILNSDKRRTIIEFACIDGRSFNFNLIK